MFDGAVVAAILDVTVRKDSKRLGTKSILSGEERGSRIYNMEDLKEIKENVKEVLTKVEDAFGSAGKTLFPNEEPRNDRDLIRYVVKAM